MSENSSKNPLRRNFLKTLGGIGLGLASLPSVLAAQTNSSSEKSTSNARPAGSIYMGGFRAPKLDQIRIAIIGVGARGSNHNNQLTTIEGVKMVAICDLNENAANAAAKIARDHKHDPKVYTGSPDAWKKMLAEVKPDAVFIVTPWELHAPMAIAAMEAGAHAFCEVPLATNIEDLWKVVDTSERTKRHCMLMENVNYGREELLYLNMVRQGVIGELLHGEAAYIHELRMQMENGDTTGSWRTFEYMKKNGNLYPTHGLGPVAQYMNLARKEDQFRRLVSFSSPAIGRHEYAAKSQKLSNPIWKDAKFNGGDINTSIIKTHVGRTIMIQWDETSPRPYSRHNLIQGTKGTLKGFPNGMAIEGVTESYHKWTTSEQFEAIAAKYEHPLYKRLGEVAKKMGGHGGMDYLMLLRIVECLRNGEALDQNVYEGAFWSSVTPLSIASVAQDGMPQDFPDFTRGDWKTTEPLAIIS